MADDLETEALFLVLTELVRKLAERQLVAPADFEVMTQGFTNWAGATINGTKRAQLLRAAQMTENLGLVATLPGLGKEVRQPRLRVVRDEDDPA